MEKLGLAILDIASYGGISFFVIILSICILLTIIHELGHLLGAWYCGVPTVKFKIGIGYGISLGKVRNCEMIIAPILLGGSVNYSIPEIFNISPIKRAFCSASGGMAVGLLATLICFYINYSHNQSSILYLIMFCGYFDMIVAFTPISGDGRGIIKGLCLGIKSKFEKQKA